MKNDNLHPVEEMLLKRGLIITFKKNKRIK